MKLNGTAKGLLVASVALGIGASVFFVPSATSNPFSGPFGTSSATPSEIVAAVEASGTIARANEDLYANTFVAGSVDEDGDPAQYGFVCNQLPCRWRMGAGTQHEIAAVSGNGIEFNVSYVSIPTLYVTQPANTSNQTVRWFADTAQFFGLLPTTDTTGCVAGKEGGLRAVSTDNTLRYCDGTALQRVTIDSPITLPTCSSALEGAVRADSASGGTSGARTRVCICTSDGGGSPAYAWQNSATASVGTTTTCP